MSRHVAIAASVASLWLLGAPLDARAQSHPSLFPTRHFVCREPRPAPALPDADRAAEPALRPLMRKRAPRALTIAPLVDVELAVAEPLPLLAPTAASPEPPPVRVVVSDNDYQCVGFHLGGDGIVDVVSAPLGARFLHHSNAHDWRVTNLRALATHHDPRPVEAVRRMLSRPVPRDGYAVFEALDLRIQAALALGDLGDSAGADALVSGLREREDASHSLHWSATLSALARMSPRTAEGYAASVVERVARGRPKPVDPRAMDDESLLRHTLPLLVTPDPARLELLRGMPRADEDCALLAARIRLGDAPLLGALRAELSTDLRTQRGAHCYSRLMPFVFPGESPDEAPTLLYRHRLESILALIGRARRAPSNDPRWARALAELRRTLSSRLGEPDVAGDRGDRRFDPQKRALTLVALAALGEPGAARQLEALYRDSSDDGVAPWLALDHALRLDLPGAALGARARLELAIRQRLRSYESTLPPQRGFVRLGHRERVVLALAERGDPHFTLGLLALDRATRELTAVELGKRRPTEACALVAASARDAEADAVHDAFWSLSMLGTACLAEARALYADAAQPDAVRGAALELRAMLRDASLAHELRPRADDPIRPWRMRAAIIHAHPDGARIQRVAQPPRSPRLD